jgi:S-DNA-T family DNA segregation ATPase FtsK/SpoIIIE
MSNTSDTAIDPKHRQMRIAAVLLALASVLMLIALVSHTEHDADNAQLTIRDLLGVIRGDEAMRVRFDTTHNWLGLLGAVMSHWLYHSTVGWFALVYPAFALLVARDLYTVFAIRPRTVRHVGLGVVSTILAASIVGTLQHIPAFDGIPAVWSGAIGQFISGVLVQFIGRTGSMLVLLVAGGFVAFFGFGLRASVLVNLASTISRRTQSLKNRVIRDPGRRVEEPAVQRSEDEHPMESETLAPITDVRPRRSRDLRQPDEPAELLRSIPKQSTSKEVDDTLSPKSLAPGVRIVRPLPRSHEPTPDRPTPERAAPEHTPDAAVERIDIHDVERRLQELHPRKKIRLVPPPTDMPPTSASPSAPQSPLGMDTEDELTADRRVHEPPPQPTEDVLVVHVEDTPPPEQVATLPTATLYDEHIAYKPPTEALLVPSTDEISVDDAELQLNASILQEKLETFRIRIENVTVQPGPVITTYEFVPGSGIKVSQIESLADDIALALKAPGVRIIAPVPGKGTVGIEIPNHKPAMVRFSGIIRSKKFLDKDIRLPIAMGKTVVGEVYCADLAKMPHLLIAGATGKGKSVGINTIIASLLYRMHPRDLKFVIIDPKRVEMTLYQALKDHFLAVCPDVRETIITEPTNAVTVLKSVVEEMQQRYSILAAAGQRNIADYNTKASAGVLKNKGGYNHRPMPYIVVIIDELADLMMTAGKDVEEPIVRLAQLARAVGIHCVVATQRPSVDVVTGLIKANFPARIAYQVASRIDSRTILDTSGAEHLIGNGDMLFNPGTLTKPMRMQNAFISTDEVEAICDHIGNQAGYSTPYMLPSVAGKRSGGGGGADDDRDVLFEDAARIFIQLQQASVSTLQRRLKVGYARAARIVDELEMAGIVGPPDGAKGRQVLLSSEAELEAYL